MSDYVMGLATGMAINNSQQSDNGNWNIQIARCNALTTKQETYSCLQQLSQQKEHEDNLFGCFFLGMILIVAMFFFYTYWRNN